LGGPLVPPPTGEGEVFMGSMTVATDGDARLGKLGKMIRKAQRGRGALGRAMRALTRRANAAGAALAKTLKLGATARNRIARAVCTVTGHPVDVATGKVFTDRVDLTLPGPIPFELERVWYSTSSYEGPLGHGWHHSYDAALYVHDDVILHRAQDGRSIAFPPLQAAEEHFLPSERITLIREQAGYAIRTRERQHLHFRDVGRASGEYVLTSIEDSVGHAIILRYDDRARITELEDSAGRTLRFVHDAADRISEIQAPHPERHAEHVLVLRYDYDDHGNLSEVRDALGQRTTYTYRHHLLRKETDRNGLSFYFEYDADDENAKCTRTWGDGGIYDHKLSYDDTRGITTVTNSLGHKTQHEHRDGLVIRSVDAHGGITLSEYDQDDRLLSQTDPLGQVTLYRYDERSNLLSVTQPGGVQLQIR
jgi:YD repeat-containing protein